jgi:hypothetical protein
VAGRTEESEVRNLRFAFTGIGNRSHMMRLKVNDGRGEMVVVHAADICDMRATSLQ